MKSVPGNKHVLPVRTPAVEQVSDTVKTVRLNRRLLFNTDVPDAHSVWSIGDDVVRVHALHRRGCSEPGRVWGEVGGAEFAPGTVVFPPPFPGLHSVRQWFPDFADLWNEIERAAADPDAIPIVGQGKILGWGQIYKLPEEPEEPD